MRVVTRVLVAAAALTIGGAGSASAGCYHDCDGYAEADKRAHHRTYHKAYRRHAYPVLLFGGPQWYMGPVYASTGKYHYGPYVSHRAVFGYGGCRTAYLAYGPTWQLASNC